MDEARFDYLVLRLAKSVSRRGVMSIVAGLAGLGLGDVVAKPSSRGGKDRGKKSRIKCDPDPCPASPQKPGKAGRCCKDGQCSCDGKCCGDYCFEEGLLDGTEEQPPTHEFCCTGPKWIRCGEGKDATCCPNVGDNPCDCVDSTGLPGSYRRPR